MGCVGRRVAILRGSVQKTRHVRTPEGETHFKLPIGSPIGQVDRLLSENKRLPGEALFAWQGRVAAALPPAQRHEMMFGLRERYAPVDFIAKGATAYRAAHNLPEPQADISAQKADPTKADHVARAFEGAADAATNPRVRQAFDDFKRQNAEMYDFITRPTSRGGLGIKVDFVPGEPYASAEAQAEDLRRNHHMSVQSGLGGIHSLLSVEEYDRFRAVHDVFGHAGIGGGFDRHGEYQAWLAHMSMYDGPGRDAMSSEYHGVNCVTPDTLVLLADLSWVRAGDLHLDDELVGFDEQLSGRGRGGSSHLRSSVVEGVARKSLPCYRIITDHGEITASADHGFVAINRTDHAREWRDTKDVRVGDRLTWTAKPWVTENTRDGGYMAGLLDGEGWVSETRVAVSQNPGEVLDEAQRVFKRLGIDIIVEIPTGRPRPTVTPNGNPYEQHTVRLTVQGGRWKSMEVLGRVRPRRLLQNSRSLWEGGDLAKRGASVTHGSSWAVVTGIEYVGEQEVVALQTSSRTFIAEGFASHNSAMWAGAPGSPGTGKSVLLPQALIRSPWDSHGNLVRKAENRPVDDIIRSLALDTGFAIASEAGPWHSAHPRVLGQPNTLKHLGDLHDQRSHGRRGPNSVSGFRRLFRALIEAGGFTINPDSGRVETSGYVVGVPGHTSIRSAAEIASDRTAARTWMADYIMAVSAHKRENPAIRLGGWYDREHSEVVLDHSELFPNTRANRRKAIALGRMRDEQAIFHLDTNTEIPTFGTGGRK